MHRLTPELAVLVLGLLGAIANIQRFPDIQAKARWVRVFFLIGVATQLLTHCFQYSFAISNKLEGQKVVERSTALALFAYTRDNVPLLKATTADSYLIGYRLFKDGQAGAAVTYFNQAVREGRFVAPSHYLLAYISSHQRGHLTQGDWTSSFEHLRRALAYDASYSPAYYLRAQLEAATNQIGPAIEDLSKAVMARGSGLSCCYFLNDKYLAENDWGNFRYNHVFTDLQRQCKEIHPTVSGTSLNESLGSAKLTAFVATADSARSKAFYENKLGLRLISEDGFALVFDSNGTTLRIQKIEKMQAPPTPLYWQVPDISEAVTGLLQHGVTFERFSSLRQNELGIWTRPDQTKAAWFKDPDGNLFSLAENAPP